MARLSTLRSLGWPSNARVAVCGTIASYNDIDLPDPIHWYIEPREQRASRMEGFLVFDYLDRFAEGQMKLVGWVADGRLAWRDTIVDGLERAPEALNMLFPASNTGKLLVKVDPTAA